MPSRQIELFGAWRSCLLTTWPLIYYTTTPTTNIDNWDVLSAPQYLCKLRRELRASSLLPILTSCNSMRGFWYFRAFSLKQLNLVLLTDLRGFKRRFFWFDLILILGWEISFATKFANIIKDSANFGIFLI